MELFVRALVSLFIILGPFGNIFIFESILDSLAVFDKKERENAIKKAFKVAYLVWIPVFLFGTYVLKFFGITIESFEIAGGILLLLIALDILQNTAPKISNVHHHEQELEKVVITPMAIPLLTGPGTITTTILYRSHINDLKTLSILFISFSLAYLLAYFVVLKGEEIITRFGRTVVIIANRLMGLILLAIAVEFITNGIKLIFFT